MPGPFRSRPSQLPRLWEAGRTATLPTSSQPNAGVTPTPQLSMPSGYATWMAVDIEGKFRLVAPFYDGYVYDRFYLVLRMITHYFPIAFTYVKSTEFTRAFIVSCHLTRSCCASHMFTAASDLVLCKEFPRLQLPPEFRAISGWRPGDFPVKV